MTWDQITGAVLAMALKMPPYIHSIVPGGIHDPVRIAVHGKVEGVPAWRKDLKLYEK